MSKRTVTPPQLLVEIRRYHTGPGHGNWPTVAQLVKELQCSQEEVQQGVDWLIDRRMVDMEGDRVMLSEAKASPLIVRQMTAEERERYGPPNRREPSSRPIGLFPSPDNKPETPQEVQNEMPTGTRIEWPSDEMFMVEVDAAKRIHGPEWALILARKYSSSQGTVRKVALEARHRLGMADISGEPMPGQAEPTESSSVLDTPAAAHTLASDEAKQGVGSPEPTPASESPTDAQQGIYEDSWAQEAEREASALTTPGEDLQAAMVTLDRVISEQAVATLATHATLILIDESADRPAQVMLVHEHLTQAPECIGDKWAEPIRVNGYRDYRIWTAVGFLLLDDGPTFVMMPVGVELVRTESRERGAA